MSERGWLTRRVFGWALFDVASSTYVAIVPTLFGLYFVAVVAQGSPSANALWGGLAAAALLVAGVLAPIAGAYADRNARAFEVIAAATVLCVVAALLLPVAARGGAVVAGIAFIAAQAGYTLATSLYDSLVVDVAPPAQRGRISGMGWALGMVGGIVAIAVALAIVQGLEAAEQARHLGATFIAAGALFALLAVPGLAGLRGLRTLPASPAYGGGLVESLRTVTTTIRRWREHRTVLQVLLAFFLINDVLVTMHFFIAIVLATRFGVAVEGLLWLSLQFHVIAIPSTALFGLAADRWGSKRTVMLMCVVLFAAIVVLAFGRAPWVPVATVGLLGLVVGSIQSVFRSLLASLVQVDKAAELFGFNAIAGRLSAALGPLIFGVASALLGGPTWALCLLLLPLAAGVWLLLAADLPASEEDEAEEAAEAA